MSEDLLLKPSNRGLGRGLNALFDDEEADAVVPFSGSDAPIGRKKEIVGIEQLQPGKLQPRHAFDDESIAQLANSIEQHGVLQPLLVRKEGEFSETYEIIAGERRWRAAQKAQLHEVPVIILDLDDVSALEIALIENLQREDLNPIDEAAGYQKLMSDYGHTQEELAKALGKSRPHIANMVRLLNLPVSVQEMVAESNLSMGHARAIITAKNPEALAKQVIAKGSSVRETEALVAEDSDKPRKSKKAAKSAQASGKDADTIALEQEISNTLGMRVSIDSADGQKGKISIDFQSLDQLDEILSKLSQEPSVRLAG